MIHNTIDQNVIQQIHKIVAQYEGGDHEITLPKDVFGYDKPVLLYIISQLLTK